MKTQDKTGEQEGWCPSRTEVDEWLKNQTLCTVSTLDNDGWPTGATVAFSVTNKGELLVGTDENSSKSRNIDNDERVAVTITDPERRITVQIKAIANKLAQTAFEDSYAIEHYIQRPESLPFRDEPDQCHILLAPVHIKFSDCRPHPWVITEY